MKKYFPLTVFIILGILFSWKFFVHSLIPIPSDSLVGLYHPYRDYFSENYPNGIPFKNFLITDPVRQQYPWRFLAISDLKKGLVPSWNPYSFAGTPLAANYQSAPYYPLNIFFALMPFSTAWSIEVVIQPILAGFFMYLFLSVLCKTRVARLIGAISFAFSSVVIAWFTWNTLVHTFLWLPLLLYAFEKIITMSNKDIFRRGFLYGFLVYFSAVSILLAGHAQVALYAFITFFIYIIYRLAELKKFVLPASVVLICAASLACVTVFYQLSEFLHFIKYSNRMIDSGSINQEGWFVPLGHLIQFVAPDFFGNPATLNYWGEWNYGELTGYVGIVGIIFGLFGVFFSQSKHKNVFIILLSSSLLFAIRNPISELPFKFGVPFLSTSQPTRLLFISVFSLAVLSSLGVEEFVINVKNRFKIGYILGGIGVLFGVLWLIVLTKNNILNLPDFLANIDVATRNLYFPTLLLIISIFFIGGVILFKAKHQKYRSLVFSGLILVLIFDLFRFGWKFTPFVAEEYLYPQTSAIEFLTKQPGLFRVMSDDNRILPPNVTISHKIQTLDGYDPLYLQNYAEFASSIVRNKPDISPFSFNRIITIQQPNNRLIDLMNVKYVLSLSDINYPNLEKVFEEEQTKIYANKNVYPRAFLVNNFKKASSKQEAIDLLYDQTIDLRKTAIVFDDINISSKPLLESEQVMVAYYNNSSVILTTNTEETRLLVLSDVYYPKWKAFIDGFETKIYEVNYAFRGVVIPSGNHRVEFKYL